MNNASEVLFNAHCLLGENPLWNGDNGCFYWEDIDAGRVHRLHLASMRHDVIYEGVTVGGFTFQTDGSLLLFRVDDIALLGADGSVRSLRRFTDEGMTRFNDVMADPEGRVYAGTIGKTPESGGVFRFDPDGSVRLMWRGTGCSNGMGFSPDLKTFYWTCSTRRKIFAFDYDRATGAVTRERLFHAVKEGGGAPDGMTVDSEGHIWSTRWGGFCLVHHAPDGTVLETHRLPVEKVSSVTLGGPGLDQFLMTTAGGAPDAKTLDGAIFRLALGRKGIPEFRSRFPLGG